jgi:hypothetical protein
MLAVLASPLAAIDLDQVRQMVVRGDLGKERGDRFGRYAERGEVLEIRRLDTGASGIEAFYYEDWVAPYGFIHDAGQLILIGTGGLRDFVAFEDDRGKGVRCVLYRGDLVLGQVTYYLGSLAPVIAEPRPDG